MWHVILTAADAHWRKNNNNSGGGSTVMLKLSSESDETSSGKALTTAALRMKTPWAATMTTGMQSSALAVTVLMMKMMAALGCQGCSESK